MLHSVVSDTAEAFDAQQHQMREPLRQQGPAGLVTVSSHSQCIDFVANLVRRHAPLVRPTRHDERLSGLVDVRPQTATEELSHARVAFERGDVRIIPRTHGHHRRELVDGDLSDIDLAEGRENLADVVQECRVGPHDENSPAGQLVAVRVQQIGSAMQANRRLAGAWTALYADGLTQVGPYDFVLFRLDRGDDVAHRANARALDLVGEDAAGAVVLGGVKQVLVLVRRDHAVRKAEPPP